MTTLTGINSQQPVTQLTESSFFGTCSDILMTLINKVQEIFMTIFHLITFGIFSNSESIDPSRVTVNPNAKPGNTAPPETSSVTLQGSGNLQQNLNAGNSGANAAQLQEQDLPPGDGEANAVQLQEQEPLAGDGAANAVQLQEQELPDNGAANIEQQQPPGDGVPLPADGANLADQVQQEVLELAPQGDQDGRRLLGHNSLRRLQKQLRGMVVIHVPQADEKELVQRGLPPSVVIQGNVPLNRPQEAQHVVWQAILEEGRNRFNAEELDRIFAAGARSYADAETVDTCKLVPITCAIEDASPLENGATIKPRRNRGRGRGHGQRQIVQKKDYAARLSDICVWLKTNAEFMGLQKMGSVLKLGKRANSRSYGLFVQKKENSGYEYGFLNPYTNSYAVFSTAGQLAQYMSENLGLPQIEQVKTRGDRQNIICGFTPLMPGEMIGTQSTPAKNREFFVAFQGLFALQRLRDFQLYTREDLDTCIEAIDELFTDQGAGIPVNPVQFFSEAGAEFEAIRRNSFDQVIQALQEASQGKICYSLFKDETANVTYGMVIQHVQTTQGGFFVTYLINPEANKPISFHKFADPESLAAYFDQEHEYSAIRVTSMDARPVLQEEDHKDGAPPVQDEDRD